MHWFCLHTKPQKESAADRYVRTELGLETYLPRLKRQKTIRRVKRWITGPLFPRYLFCRLDLTQHYRAVRYAPEVINLVSFGGKPTVVEETIINELRSWAGEAVDIITVTPRPKAGDLVEITDGPLCGLQAIFERDMSDQERVTVLLTTLATRPRAVLHRSQVSLLK